MAKRTEITVIFQRDQYTTLAGNRCMDDPRPGTSEWCAWLEDYTIDAFGFTSEAGIHYTAQRECRQRGGSYWYGYRKQDGKLRKAYIGRTSELELPRLLAVAERLATTRAATTLPVEKPAPAPEDVIARDYLLLLGKTVGYLSVTDARFHREEVHVGHGEDAWRAFTATANAAMIERITRQAIHLCYNYAFSPPRPPTEDHFAWCATGRISSGTRNDHRELGRYEDRRGNWWCKNCGGQHYWMSCGETLGYPAIEADCVLTVRAGYESWLKYAQTTDPHILLLMRRIAGQLCDNHYARLAASSECKHRRCMRQDCEHTDYLGSRWCPSHFYHAALLNVGVILGFPLLEAEGHTLDAGKEAWTNYAEREKNNPRLMKLLGASHTMLLREEQR
jgi:hypothetical protein